MFVNQRGHFRISSVGRILAIFGSYFGVGRHTNRSVLSVGLQLEYTAARLDTRFCCPCVCVCVRARERERESFVFQFLRG